MRFDRPEIGGLVEPICVTSYGEAIVPFPNRGPHVVPEDSPMKAMQHELCSGLVSLHRVSEHRQALHCAACGLRVYVPAHVRTFADLRQHARLLAPRPRVESNAD